MAKKRRLFPYRRIRIFFYCFGCHAGGDVFTFIMKEENCTFQEALKILANKLGIPVPEREKTRQEIEREKETKEIIAANELATRFYQPALPKASLANWRSVILLAGALRRKLSKNFLSACRCRAILRL